MSELVMEHSQFHYHLKFYLRLSVGFFQWSDYFLSKNCQHSANIKIKSTKLSGIFNSYCG